MHALSGPQSVPLADLLRAVDVRTIAVDVLGDDQRGLAVDLAGEASLVAGDPRPDAVVIGATGDVAGTHAALDAGARLGEPALIVVVAPHPQDRGDVARWAGRNAGWLVLVDPPDGYAILAPVATLVNAAELPGSWSGGGEPFGAPVPAPETPRRAERQDPAADSVERDLRAQLARQVTATETQRLEVDRLRARWLEEREWVASEADRARASASRRAGDRMVRGARLLAFRHDRGTDALSRLADRMRAPVDQ